MQVPSIVGNLPDLPDLSSVGSAIQAMGQSRGPQLGHPTIGSQFMPQRPMAQETSMQDPAIQGFLAGLAAVTGAKLPNTDTAAPKSAVTSTAPSPPSPPSPSSPRKAAASAKRAKVGAKLGGAANQADSTALLNSLALELAKGSIDYNQFMAALEKERTTRGTANRTYQGLLEGV